MKTKTIEYLREEFEKNTGFKHNEKQMAYYYFLEQKLTKEHVKSAEEILDDIDNIIQEWLNSESENTTTLADIICNYYYRLETKIVSDDIKDIIYYKSLKVSKEIEKQLMFSEGAFWMAEQKGLTINHPVKTEVRDSKIIDMAEEKYPEEITDGNFGKYDFNEKSRNIYIEGIKKGLTINQKDEIKSDVWFDLKGWIYRNSHEAMSGTEKYVFQSKLLNKIKELQSNEPKQ